MNAPVDRLLLVEDDARICRRLARALQEASFLVDVCCTLAEARTRLFGGYALVLLDLGLPDGHGLELCRELRSAGDHTPVIVLTARGAPAERVRGLEAGADDYIAKPFHLPELIARIHAVLRRSQPIEDEGRLSCGPIWLDPVARTAGLGPRALDLKRREFELLSFLLCHPGRAWTRAQLLARVWGHDFVGEEHTVDIHIGRLRAHVEENARRPRMIQTVWGVGYRLVEEG